jgi:hypothetical protein
MRVVERREEEMRTTGFASSWLNQSDVLRQWKKIVQGRPHELYRIQSLKPVPVDPEVVMISPLPPSSS